MTAYFFDSNTLTKWYINETGTTWVRRVIMPSSGHTIFKRKLRW